MKKLIFITLIFILSSSYLIANEFEDDFSTDEFGQTDTEYVEDEDSLYFINNIFFKTYKFSYTYFLKYVAKTYAYTPLFIKDRINSFITNLGEPRNFISHLSQGRINAASESAFRFVFNSTFGFLGVFDIMEVVGMPVKYNDVGATLYFYGVPDGPYVTFLGPSNLRDFSAMITSNYFLDFIFLDPLLSQNYIYKIRIYEDIHMKYVGVISTINAVSIYDEYSFYFENSVDEYGVIKSFYTDYRNNVLATIASYD